MAKIEHANISDPYIHEPKGIQFAADGQAYIADGAGGGAWSDILTPSDIGLYPGVEFSFYKSHGGAELDPYLQDLNLNLEKAWDGGSVSNTDRFISITSPGLYLVSLYYSIDEDADEVEITPTKTSGSLTQLSIMTPKITTYIVTDSIPRYGKRWHSATFIDTFVIGEGFGIFGTNRNGTIVSGAIQLVRLRDA